MNHLRGLPREQRLLLPEAVEDYVAPEAPVRFIDACVEMLDVSAGGQQTQIDRGTRGDQRNCEVERCVASGITIGSS